MTEEEANASRMFNEAVATFVGCSDLGEEYDVTFETPIMFNANQRYTVMRRLGWQWSGCIILDSYHTPMLIDDDGYDLIVQAIRACRSAGGRSK